MKTRAVLALALSAAALAGCSTTMGGSAPVDVTRYHLSQPIPAGTVAVQPVPGGAAGPEAQLAALADDIAYDNHDLDEAGRRVAILGDMLELGCESEQFHRGLAAPLVEAGARIVHTVGSMMTHLADELPADMRGTHAPDAATLAVMPAGPPPITRTSQLWRSVPWVWWCM